MDNNKQKFYQGECIDYEAAWKRQGCKRSEPSTIAYFVIGKGCRLKKVVHRGEE